MIVMPATKSLPADIFAKWMAEGLNMDAIRERMMTLGLAEQDINIQLKAFKKKFYQKRQTRGFILMGTGAFVGFLSCVLTMTDLFPALNNLFLYGLTSIAVCIAIFGAYLVFEE